MKDVVNELALDGELILERYREDLTETQLFPVGCIFKSFLSVWLELQFMRGKFNPLRMM